MATRLAGETSVAYSRMSGAADRASSVLVMEMTWWRDKEGRGGEGRAVAASRGAAAHAGEAAGAATAAAAAKGRQTRSPRSAHAGATLLRLEDRIKCSFCAEACLGRWALRVAGAPSAGAAQPRTLAFSSLCVEASGPLYSTSWSGS